MQPSRNDIASPEALALDLYAALLDGCDLGPALGAIATALGATSQITQVVQFDGPHAIRGTRVATTNLDPAAVADYERHWVRRDPWALAATAHLTGAFSLDRVVTAEQFARTEYWNDFARQWNGPFHGLAAQVGEPGDVLGVFCAHRTRAGEAFGAREEAFLERILPHLRRVLAAQVRLSQAGWQAAAAGLDALRQGVALIGRDGRLVIANAALHRMAAEGDGLSLGRSGLLCRDAQVQGALNLAVLSALAGADGRIRVLPVAGSLAIPRPSGAAPWLVQALPVRPGIAGPGGAGPLSALGGGFAGAMLLVTDAEARPPAPSRVLLEKALGLTPAEAALAAALARGTSPAAHAKARRVSVETVRTHLAALRRKTGCRRQAEIALLAARLAGG